MKQNKVYENLIEEISRKYPQDYLEHREVESMLKLMEGVYDKVFWKVFFEDTPRWTEGGKYKRVEVLNCLVPHKPRILIGGHARHGKDTMAEILRDELDLRFISSSLYVAKALVYPELMRKYNYKSIKECYEDRVNKRKEWFDLISEYNKEDKVRLVKEILLTNDIYVGLRGGCEFDEALKQGLFDLTIWVDASGRLPLESLESNTLDPNKFDLVITNNTTEEDFRNKVLKFINIYAKK